ncbi:MAG TPA: alpha/beta hydrolase [Egicoccus sp.]|nr:alpha/beta hydrolase [Egicoccus sp.]HSK22888.1 alpha/beta hydrolase [Egicoccus sp.]
MAARPAAIRLNTHVWNPVGERRALLLHGLASDGTSWWRLASTLAEQGWLVLAPDLRSHGASPPAINHSIAAMAADVALLGDGWDLLVGHSLGGAVAAWLLAEADAARNAVLVDPVLRLDPDQHRAVWAAHHDEVGDLDADAVAAANPAWHPRDVARKVLAARRVTPDVIDAVFADNDPWDVTAAATHWQARVHLLAADSARGGLLAPSLAQRLASGTVSAQTVSGCGHSIHRERPDVLTEAIARTLGAEEGRP